MTLMVARGERQLARQRPGPRHPSQRVGGSLEKRTMAVGETEDPIRPALFRASRGQSPSPETGSRNPRVTLDRPLYLRGLGLPIWKVGVGTPAPHRGGQCGGQTSDGAKRKTGKGDRDRTSRRGRVSQALTLGPAWTMAASGVSGGS